MSGGQNPIKQHKRTGIKLLLILIYLYQKINKKKKKQGSQEYQHKKINTFLCGKNNIT